MFRNKDDNWVRRFAVSDPRRHNKGYTVYKVTSVVFPKHSPEAASRVVVWKRYSEFKKLHRELKIKHQKLHLKDIFPTFAKARFFGRFEDDVIEERRMCALNLLEFVGKNSVLFTSNVVVKFFESGHVVEDQQMRTELSLPTDVQIVITEENPGGGGGVGTATDGASHGHAHSGAGLGMAGTEMDVAVLGDGMGVSAAGVGVSRAGAGADVSAPVLGGTWQFPQAADTISLSSHSSDDRTTFTDTDSAVSGVSSPLQVGDLQFFDPLAKDESEAGGLPFMESAHPHVVMSNSALLSAEMASPTEASVTPPAKSDCLSVRTQDFSMAASQAGDGAGYSQVTEGLLSSDVFLPSTSAPSSGHQDVNYVFEAAYHVGRAQQYEANEDYEAAFAFYKAGVACLLSGVQDDPDPKRKQAVKVKTTRYLLQAERIYNQHLAVKASTKHSHKAVLRQQEASFASQLLRPPEELSLYKVLGVVNKVLLVLHSLDDRCYIMKVVHKSPCPVGPDKRTIIPQNVPFMVPLHKYYETESGIFLVLKHASGGRLWDHVGSYFQSLPQTPTQVGPRDGDWAVNKPARESPPSKVDVEPCDKPPSPSDQDHSYSELIEDYKSCKNSDQTCEDLKDATSGVAESLKMLTPISGSKESIHQAPSVPDVGSVRSTPRSVVPDLVPREQWGEAGDIPTMDLVAKAQRLLESVSKTLHASETAASLASKEREQVRSDKQEVKPKSRGPHFIGGSPTEVSPKASRWRERPRSSSRKLSRRFSGERRYSSDDMFEGRGRACSGSLDCFQAKVEQFQPRLPEATVRVWAAEILVAIETLHRWGIICRDLNPDNILLGDGGHVYLTYQCQWASVDCVLSREAVEGLYAAPEVRSIFPLSPSVDWWSYGALLFELLTSKSVYYCHPGGIHNHTILNVPQWVSNEARHLLTELLRFNPVERLGSGMNGTQELKSHPFFSNVNWDSILDVGTTCS